MWYVYIIKCSNGSIYTGCTDNLERRLSEHNNHKIHYTSDKTPVTLLCFIAVPDKFKAFILEKYLKSGSGIAFRNRHLI